jgi:hypothetical protein
MAHGDCPSRWVHGSAAIELSFWNNVAIRERLSNSVGVRVFLPDRCSLRSCRAISYRPAPPEMMAGRKGMYLLPNQLMIGRAPPMRTSIVYIPARRCNAGAGCSPAPLSETLGECREGFLNFRLPGASIPGGILTVSALVLAAANVFFHSSSHPAPRPKGARKTASKDNDPQQCAIDTSEKQGSEIVN